MTRAEKMIAFIETLRTPDGAGVGQPFVLRGWQKAIIREVYDAEDGEGRRVVRQAVLSMSRKNGKTALVAGLCLAHLCGPEAVRNGQLYSLAHDREQASVLFKLMTAMIYMDEELSERLNVVESRKRLVDPVSGSEFTALSSETRGKHGKSSSFIVFDELAQFGADRELYDVMMTSRGAHADPLVWCISTQAASDNAVLSELIDYGQKVNRGEIEDPKFKTFLFRCRWMRIRGTRPTGIWRTQPLAISGLWKTCARWRRRRNGCPRLRRHSVTSISTSAWTARRISSPRKSGGGAAGNRIWRCLRICPCSADSICPERTTLPR